MGLLSEKITNADLFSPEVYFKVNGYIKYKNFFGGLLTILSFFVTFAAIIYFVNDFFSRKSATIITEETRTNIVEIKNFNKYPFMIRMSDSFNLGPSEPEKYYKIVMSYWIYKANETDPDRKMIKLVYWIDMQKCNISNPTHFGPEYKSYYQNFTDIGDFFCANNYENRNLIGLYGDSKSWSIYHLYFRKCINSTDGDICATNDELTKFFSSSYVDFRIINFNILPLNKSPNEVYVYGERIAVSTSVFRRMWVYFKTIYFNSDIGYIFQNVKTESFYIIEKYSNDIDIRDTSNIAVPYSFFTLTLLNNNFFTTYTRAYMKAQSLLANVGGIIKGITMIAYILNYYIGWRLYYLYLINNLPDVLNATVNDYNKIAYDFEENYNSIFNNTHIKNSNLTKHEDNRYFNIISYPNDNKIEIKNSRDRCITEKRNSNEINNLIPKLNEEQVNNSPKNHKIDRIMPRKKTKIEYKIPIYIKNNIKLTLQIWQVLLPTFMYCYKNKKFKLYEKAYDHLQEEMEVTTVLNKINQFEKLKNGILSEDQLTVFNFIFQTPNSSEKKKSKYMHDINFRDFLTSKENIKYKLRKENFDEFLMSHFD